MMDAGVQSGAQPQISTCKMIEHLLPRWVYVSPRDGIGRRNIFVQNRPSPRSGLLSLLASATNPGGISMIRSPCDIHTADTASRMVPGISGWISAGPYSRRADGSTLPPEGMHQQLHPVADPEHRQAGLEHIAGQRRRALGIDRGRSARKDEALGIQCQHFFSRRVPREEFAVDVRLAHPPGDQLGVLGTKIEDGDGLMRHGYINI